MKIAKITNIALANAAMAQLVNRQDGLPGLGVLYGPSGYGKTTATVAVANQTRAYYVQLRSAWTRKTFMEKVCVELGVEKGRNTAECLDNICARLAASQRPLIIDEADYLVGKAGMVELAHGSVRRVVVNLVNLADAAKKAGTDSVDMAKIKELPFELYRGESPKRGLAK